MGIFCDHQSCSEKTHQPLPQGWDIEWVDEHYEHFCPVHASRGPAATIEAKARAEARRPIKRKKPEPKKKGKDQGSLF